MKNTIKNSNDINTLFSSGKWLKTAHLKIVFLKSTCYEYMVVAPIKLHKRANKRNRIKRLLREALRTINLGNYKISILYNAEEIISLNEIKQEILSILDKIK